MEVSSKTPAVVTGGASGLGEATARALAAKGAKVAIFDMNEEKGEAVAKDIGGIFCKVNVTSDETSMPVSPRRVKRMARNASSSIAQASAMRSRPPAATSRAARSSISRCRPSISSSRST